jgi:kynurenine formamidase
MVLFHHGIHIIEVAYLEGLARDKVYEFVFIFGANKLKGATGSNIRMFAIN